MQAPAEASAATAVTTERNVRVASYNIHRCIGSDSRANAARIAQVVRELDCDLIALQEVDNQPGPHVESMQLDYLAHATDMQAIAGHTILRHEGHYGNALLTRCQILDVRRHDFSFRHYEPRGAIEAQLQCGAEVLHIIVTHLGLHAVERRHQFRALLDLINNIPEHRTTIVAGDMNEWLPWSRAVRRMNSLCGTSQARATFPAWCPILALDRIWTRAPATVTKTDAWRSSLAKQASDHLPLLATVELANRTVIRR
jgi:endonuclease/exonuclease/phosphatase family metal-dependent hydrolase